MIQARCFISACLSISLRLVLPKLVSDGSPDKTPNIESIRCCRTVGSSGCGAGGFPCCCIICKMSFTETPIEFPLVNRQISSSRDAIAVTESSCVGTFNNYLSKKGCTKTPHVNVGSKLRGLRIKRSGSIYCVAIQSRFSQTVNRHDRPILQNRLSRRHSRIVGALADSHSTLSIPREFSRM